MTRETQERMRFYLTQRLTRRQYTQKSGFDALFECQYMGAAEFEWGALPESLKRIRAAKRVAIHEGEVTRGEVTMPVYVVGDESRITQVPDDLTAWMVDHYPRGKEITYFPERIDGATQPWHERTHAWWSLSDDVMWALDRNTADLLLKAVRS